MEIRFVRHGALLIVVLIAIGVCFVEAGAQKRKRRPRRVTHSSPALKPSPAVDDSTDSSEPKIVSTADQITSTTKTAGSQRPKPAPTPAPESEAEALRRTISELSGQLNKLNDKLVRVEEQQRSLVDMELLSRAEQRAEGFRAQLRDVQQKETDIQGQLDQIEYSLQPENIERAVGLMGTTHPEEARDQRHRQLESQRTKVKAQYDQLEQSRVRLEAAIATADREVDNMRLRIDAASVEANQPLPAKTIIVPARTSTYPPPPIQEPPF